MPAYKWTEVWKGPTEPYEAGGIKWGGYTALHCFGRERRTKSKGWRRHIRRQKQAKRKHA